MLFWLTDVYNIQSEILLPWPLFMSDYFFILILFCTHKLHSIIGRRHGWVQPQGPNDHHSLWSEAGYTCRCIIFMFTAFIFYHGLYRSGQDHRWPCCIHNITMCFLQFFPQQISCSMKLAMWRSLVSILLPLQLNLSRCLLPVETSVAISLSFFWQYLFCLLNLS